MNAEQEKSMVAAEQARMAAGADARDEATEPDPARAAEAPANAEIQQPRAALPAPQPEPETPAPEASHEKQTLQLLARVVSSKGRSLNKDSSCVINVHLTGSKITDLDVACGSEQLYDSRTPLNGMASMGSSLHESPGARSGQWVYSVAYTDTGMRSSRTQITLNSGLKKANVFSGSADNFQVELRVAEHTAPREGEPLFNTPTHVEQLALLVVGSSVEGEADLPTGKCTLTSRFVSASTEGLRCKTALTCGKQVLYGTGSSGYGPCTVEGETIVGFEDDKQTFEDGDPSLVIDMQQAQITLSDSPSQKPYEIRFATAQ
jgi:hypothetical protein